MKRKVYATVREQKTDQLVGLIAFPLINILLWGTGYGYVGLAPQGTDDSLLGLLLVPWIVNSGFVILAFIFRPHIGVGYLASFWIIIVGVMVLGVLFLAACFTAFIAAAGFTGFTVTNSEVSVWIFFLLFLALLLGGLFFIGRWVVKAFNTWWSCNFSITWGGKP